MRVPATGAFHGKGAFFGTTPKVSSRFKFCEFVLPCQILLPPIKTVGSTIRQPKILPVKLCFINVYTYHNLKPTLTVMHIQ